MLPFDFSLFPTLTTGRLVLRAPTPADADDIFVFRSDADAQKHNSAPMLNVSEARVLIEELCGGYAGQQILYWAVTLKDDDQVVGLVGYNYWDRGHNLAAIGFDISRTYWGKGIGSEAVRAIVPFGFRVMQLNRIEAMTVTDNVAALGLLEKVGFQREGARRELLLQKDGTYQDLAMYGLLRREFALD